MSQSTTALKSTYSANSSVANVRRIDTGNNIGKLFYAIEDADCRAILDATSTEALSANEVSEVCDLPLSTTYRKLELLSEARLLKERIRISSTGKHANEYVRLVKDIDVSISDRGKMELRVEERTDTDQLESLQ